MRTKKVSIPVDILLTKDDMKHHISNATLNYTLFYSDLLEDYPEIYIDITKKYLEEWNIKITIRDDVK